MKTKIVLAIVLILMLVPLTSAYSLTFDPVDFTVDLTAGQTTTRSITITNEDKTDLLLYITTEIEPDGEGINVTYSVNSPFTIKSSQVITVEMPIKTDMLLMPKQYVISTIFDGESIETYDKEKVTFTKSKPGSNPIIPIQPPEYPNYEQFPGEEGPVVFPPYINEVSKEDFNILFLLVGLLIFFILFILLLFLYVRKRGNENT